MVFLWFSCGNFLMMSVSSPDSFIRSFHHGSAAPCVHRPLRFDLRRSAPNYATVPEQRISWGYRDYKGDVIWRVYIYYIILYIKYNVKLYVYIYVCIYNVYIYNIYIIWYNMCVSEHGVWISDLFILEFQGLEVFEPKGMGYSRGVLSDQNFGFMVDNYLRLRPDLYFGLKSVWVVH